jgi:hypothetical protein
LIFTDQKNSKNTWSPKVEKHTKIIMIDPNNFLPYSVWLELSMATRMALADMFGFKMRGARHTMDNRVISDGFLHTDLAVITKERMAEVLGIKADPKADFFALFSKVVDKIEGKTELETPVEPTNTPTNTDVQQKEQAESLPASAPDATGNGEGRKKKGKVS